MLGFIPVAEASVETLMKSINKVIINPIIYFLFALALAYFLFGIAQYLLNPDNEEINKKSKSQMFTGIVGLFIMVAVFGIMNLILHTVGEKNIRLENTGNYVVTKDQADSNDFNTYTGDLNEVDVTDGLIDVRGGGNIDLTNVKTVRPTNFYESPFMVKYLDNSLCRHFEVHMSAPTEYQSIKAVKAEARKKLFLTKTQRVLNYGLLTAYDPSEKFYHSWMDARHPINGGNNNNCVLKIDKERTKELPLDNYVHDNPFTKVTDKGISIYPFTNSYKTDDLYHRVVMSGRNPILELAREIAIKNAFLLLGIELEDVNTMTIVFPTASIIDEQYKYNEDTGEYEYWVAIESKKITNVVSDGIKVSPFTNAYKSDSLFVKVIDYASSANASEARDIAISNAITKLSKEIVGSNKTKFVNILEEKQIFNKKTGKYEYWVAVEGSTVKDGTTPVAESTNPSLLSKVYKSDQLYIRVIDSSVGKDLSIAKDLAMKNAILKLSSEIDASTGTKFVYILEEKYIFNKNTGEYEYWVAIESKR